MYFKNVNRGMSFTKAGVYTTGLVMLLGFLATSSGSNAFFIALGFGLSLLIISGLLSERSMKHFRFERLQATTAEAGKPFSVPFTVRNASRTWFLFGVESLALVQLPRFRLLNAKLPSDMEARLLSLPPGETREVSGRCRGLARGFYDRFYIVQRTLFPFGLISKFKVSEVGTAISILPALDAAFAETIARELVDPAHGHQPEQEFHSHRPMNPRDSKRSLDWKKNAGKPKEHWVVRTYHSAGDPTRVRVRCDWAYLRHCSDEGAYEAFVSRLRSACEAVARSGRTPVLELPDGSYLLSLFSVLDRLVRLPAFTERAKLDAVGGGQALSGDGPRLVLFSHHHEWSKAA